MANLNDTVQQSDIVPIGGSCEERCYPVSDLLCHTLRTHAVILQEQLDTTYKPGTKEGTMFGDTVNAIMNLFFWSFTSSV